MKSQEDNNSISIKGFVFATIMFLPHYAFYTAISLYRFIKDINRFFNKNKWVLIILIILYPLGIISLLFCICFILLVLFICAFIDYYGLCVGYSKYSFIEATKLFFVELFNEDSEIFNFKSDVEMTI